MGGGHNGVGHDGVQETELSEAEALCWRLVGKHVCIGVGYRVEKRV